MAALTIAARCLSRELISAGPAAGAAGGSAADGLPRPPAHPTVRAAHVAAQVG
jgi:hypothetical protein